MRGTAPPGFELANAPADEDLSVDRMCDKVVAMAEQHPQLLAESAEVRGAVAAARAMRCSIAVRAVGWSESKGETDPNCIRFLGDAVATVESIRLMAAHMRKHNFPHKIDQVDGESRACAGLSLSSNLSPIINWVVQKPIL